MNKEFCIGCGHKNLFETTRPKFCAGCGQPLNTSMASVASNKKPIKRLVMDEDDTDDEALDLEGLDRDALKASIVWNGATKVMLDDIWKQAAPSVRTSRPPSKDDGDILKTIQAECAPITRSKDIEE